MRPDADRRAHGQGAPTKTLTETDHEGHDHRTARVRQSEDFAFQLAEAVVWLDALDVELLAVDHADHLLTLSGRIRQRLSLALVREAA